MDTERDENQNLKNDFNITSNDSEGSKEKHNHTSYENEITMKEQQYEYDYADDQNNSNTGYTEKLLEKEFELNQKKKGAEIEKDVDIEHEIFIKNGNTANSETSDESIKEQKEKIDESDGSLYNDNDEITENPKFAVD